MNLEIKALVALLLGVEKVGADIVAKDASTIILGDVVALMPQALGAMNFGALKGEISAMEVNANGEQADIAEYIGSVLVGGSAKSQDICKAAFAMVFAGEALYKAIKE